MTISGNVTFTAQFEAKAVESYPQEITTGAYRIADGYLRAIPVGTTARQLLAGLSPSDYITLPPWSPATSAATAGSPLPIWSGCRPICWAKTPSPALPFRRRT